MCKVSNILHLRTAAQPPHLEALHGPRSGPAPPDPDWVSFDLKEVFLVVRKAAVRIPMMYTTGLLLTGSPHAENGPWAQALVFQNIAM